uniref:Uncharacterized protein n=1 Tax=Trypanosoma brucei TaxID=5691 RepID=Q581N9_9TRYP|nr:hypothetical protein, unlikely [Trypanosoma brucei]
MKSSQMRCSASSILDARALSLSSDHFFICELIHQSSSSSFPALDRYFFFFLFPRLAPPFIFIFISFFFLFCFCFSFLPT